jgi:hypothetical protein
VRVFPRRSADKSGSTGQELAAAPSPGDPGEAGGVQVDAGGADRASVTAGKGRPTPKRSEAERRHRQPFSAPTDRKAATQQTRNRDKESRAKKYAAMRRGEEWALAVKDRGPVRALARDFVDSRRRLSEFYMYGLGVLVVLLFVPATRLFVDYVVLVIVLIMIGEGLYLGRQVLRLAAQRFPGERTRGVRLYAMLRAMQIRRLRMPAPRVKPGDTF